MSESTLVHPPGADTGKAVSVAPMRPPVPLEARLYFAGETLPPNDPLRLHQSLAKVLVAQSPLHCWYKAFGEKPEDKEYKAPSNLGSVAHELLLGGAKIVEVDAPDWRTNAAKEARDSAVQAGKLPILKDALEEAGRMVRHVETVLKHHGIPLDCYREVTAIWQAPNGAWCEGRMDLLDLPIIYTTTKKGKRRKRAKKHLQTRIHDVKFTLVQATKKKCEAHFIEYGYDIQAYAYTQAIETIYPELAGRIKPTFSFHEVNEPWASRFMPLAGTMMTSGMVRWARACELWKRYLEECGTDKPWPGYLDDGERAECPPWELNRQVAEMDQFNPEEE